VGGSCSNCGSCGTGSFNGGRYCWCGSNDDLCEGCPNWVATDKSSGAAMANPMAHGLTMLLAAVAALLA
jgi:hypothetical protein